MIVADPYVQATLASNILKLLRQLASQSKQAKVRMHSHLSAGPPHVSWLQNDQVQWMSTLMVLGFHAHSMIKDQKFGIPKLNKQITNDFYGYLIEQINLVKNKILRPSEEEEDLDGLGDIPEDILSLLSSHSICKSV